MRKFIADISDRMQAEIEEAVVERRHYAKFDYECACGQIEVYADECGNKEARFFHDYKGEKRHPMMEAAILGALPSWKEIKDDMLGGDEFYYNEFRRL